MDDEDEYCVYTIPVGGARKRIDELYVGWYLESNPQTFYKTSRGWGIRRVVR